MNSKKFVVYYYYRKMRKEYFNNFERLTLPLPCELDSGFIQACPSELSSPSPGTGVGATLVFGFFFGLVGDGVEEGDSAGKAKSRDG